MRIRFALLLGCLTLLGAGCSQIRPLASRSSTSPAPSSTAPATPTPSPGNFFASRGPEGIAFDGSVAREASFPEPWEAIHDGGGNASQPSVSQTSAPLIRQQDPKPSYDFMRRAILEFDTSSLPDDQPINAARIELYVNDAGDTIGDQQAVIVPVEPPSSNLPQDTYEWVGTTALSDPLPIEKIKPQTTIAFPLNEEGRARISRTGTSHFAIVMESDRANEEPPWVGKERQAFIFIDFTEGPYPPRLIIKE